jgi:transcriptional regulator with XRE-family HTH domain
VRVRNAEWAEYVSRLRAASGLSRAELGRRIGTDESTVWRWETKGQEPKDPEVVERLTALLGQDLDEALGVAGFRPRAELAELPEVYDPEVERILADATLTQTSKEYLLDVLTSERDRAKAAISERMDFLIEAERRRAG